MHRFGIGLWSDTVGAVELVGTSVSKAAEVAHYMLPLNQMQNLLSAGYESYQNGELTWDEWHESLSANLKREHQEDIARLLGVEPEDVSQQGLEEAMNKVTEAYDIAAFIADDPDSREMLTQFAKDMADAQSSLDWAEFAGAGVFEIVLAALLAVFTGGAGNVAQAASKLRHAAHLRRLGHLFQKLARLLRLKKFNKKIEAPVDQKTTTKTDQPDIIALKPREPYHYSEEQRTLAESRSAAVPNKVKPSYVHGQSDGGKGVWGYNNRTSGSGSSWAKYQSQVTGAPDGTEYLVKTDLMSSGKKWFDGYDPERNVLIDSKRYLDWPKESLPFSVNNVLEDARMESAIAKQLKTKVEWHIPSREKAELVEKIMRENRVKHINVVYSPIGE